MENNELRNCNQGKSDKLNTR